MAEAPDPHRSGNVTVIRLMRDIKAHPRATIVLVADEFGVIQGLATAHDILEAIAGDFPDEGDREAMKALSDGVWLADGQTDLIVEQHLGIEGLADDEAEVPHKPATCSSASAGSRPRRPPRSSGTPLK